MLRDGSEATMRRGGPDWFRAAPWLYDNPD
jgi:hypothetical protein